MGTVCKKLHSAETEIYKVHVHNYELGNIS